MNTIALAEEGYNTHNDIVALTELLFSLRNKYGEDILNHIKSMRKSDYEDYEIVEQLIEWDRR
jgi:hypothetical protein